MSSETKLVCDKYSIFVKHLWIDLIKIKTKQTQIQFLNFKIGQRVVMLDPLFYFINFYFLINSIYILYYPSLSINKSQF